MKIMLRTTAAAVATWAVPFLVSVPLVGPEGTLRLPFLVFKAVLVTVLVATAVLAARWLLRHAGPVRTGVAAAVGAAAALLNVVLDLLVLVPLTRPAPLEYVTQVALAYVLIPAVAVLLAASNRTNRARSARPAPVSAR
jgi:hypothetical protein